MTAIIIILISVAVILSVYSLLFVNLQRSCKLISLTSLIISIVAICCASFRMSFEIKDSVAFIALIVGIVILPTTIVLGWNIYQLIDVKNLRNELAEAKKYKEELKIDINKKAEEIWSNYILDQMSLSALEHAYNNMAEAPERLFSTALTLVHSKLFDRKSITSILGFEYAHRILCFLSEVLDTPKQYSDFAQKVKDEGLKKEVFDYFKNEYRTQSRNEKVDSILRHIDEVIK